MKPVKVLLVIAVLFFAFASASTSADTIELQNGRTLQGEIIGQSDNYIDMRIGTGKMTFNRKDVKSFEINEPAEGYSQAEPSGPEKKTEGKEVSAESEEPKPLLKLNVAAEYTNGRIMVTGRSGLSKETPINVYFVRQGDIITMKQASTRGDNFFVAFGPFEKQILSAGKYTIEAKGVLKGQVIAAGSCPLVIGTAAQINKNEGDDKQRLAGTMAKIQALYGDLNSTYAKNKKNLDKKKWDEWSEGWLRDADSQRRTLEDYSRVNVALLYPKAHKSLEGSMNQIILLHTAYSLEFAKTYDAVPPSQKIMLEPQSLNRSIAENLATAQKELEAK